MAPFLLSHSEKGPPAPHQYWVYVFMYCAAVISPNVTAYLHNSSERYDQKCKRNAQNAKKGNRNLRMQLFFLLLKMSPFCANIIPNKRLLILRHCQYFGRTVTFSNTPVCPLSVYTTQMWSAVIGLIHFLLALQTVSVPLFPLHALRVSKPRLPLYIITFPSSWKTNSPV